MIVKIGVWRPDRNRVHNDNHAAIDRNSAI